MKAPVVAFLSALLFGSGVLGNDHFNPQDGQWRNVAVVQPLAGAQDGTLNPAEVTSSAAVSWEVKQAALCGGLIATVGYILL
ncbi:hypothetical protein MP638_004765 [Amoeboaphelidium occidentale]|nr:hypothetical protein MP638_004765 [Amoeboaphelidium occidentale]